MKKIFPLGFIFISLFLNNCSSNLPTSPQDIQQGGISLTIDRVHKPDNVVSVTAYLTRENFDTLSGSLNLLSDTTADITFNDIAAGNWHLKVDAADEQNTVVYTGEADVNILADITTQVYLTLEPTGAGYGNIYIYVNWGVPANLSWLDYQNNPILSVEDIPYYTTGVSQAQIMYDENIYKMWFMNLYSGGRGDISYAESIDGLSWEVLSNGPVLTAGDPGSWDDYTVGMGYVIKDDGIYKMYYIGMQEPLSGMRQIGLATSTNGIDWIKRPDPVLTTNFDEFYLGVHSILRVNGAYYMYYDSSPMNSYFDFVINLTTSPDGINWTRYSGNPVLVSDQNWEGISVRHATLVNEANSYKMIYSNETQSGLGMAYSSDGINWLKEPLNPIFSLNDLHNNWAMKISYPCFGRYGNQYRIYYTGTDQNYVWNLAVAIFQ